jgi:hypothetical protein
MDDDDDFGDLLEGDALEGDLDIDVRRMTLGLLATAVLRHRG